MSVASVGRLVAQECRTGAANTKHLHVFSKPEDCNHQAQALTGMRAFSEYKLAQTVVAVEGSVPSPPACCAPPRMHLGFGTVKPITSPPGHRVFASMLSSGDLDKMLFPVTTAPGSRAVGT